MSLVVENLCQHYSGAIRALDGVSLAVADGERVTVVGPSGSGKSTLLRLVAGLERATTGTIHINGRDVTTIAPRRRDVAMVFQNAVLFPHLSVLGNLTFGLRLRRTPREEIDRRVHEVATALAIGALLDRRAVALSGGERQRVALARAVVRKAACTLMDEPLAHLDPPLAESLRTCLLRLHQAQPRTTLHVTHDQREALMLGQRVLVLWAGKARQLGAPSEIYDRPSDRFVAGFFGLPPMQMIAGRLQSQGDSLLFASESFRWPILDSHSKSLHAAGQTDVVLGVRPAAVRLQPATEALAAGAFPATVRLVESDEARSLCHLDLSGGGSLIAQDTMQARWPVGAKVHVTLDDQRLHFFAADEQGIRIA